MKLKTLDEAALLATAERRARAEVAESFRRYQDRLTLVEKLTTELQTAAAAVDEEVDQLQPRVDRLARLTGEEPVGLLSNFEYHLRRSFEVGYQRNTRGLAVVSHTVRVVEALLGHEPDAA